MKKASLLQILWYLIPLCVLIAGGIAKAQIHGPQQWSYVSIILLCLLCWVYLSIRLIGFRVRLYKFFRQLLDNDYEAGIHTRRRYMDEISRLETLANHVVERLRTYDRLRAQRVSIQTRAFDLLFDRSADPLAAIDVAAETIHLNSAAQQVFGIERRSFSFESVLKPEINCEFRDQFHEAIFGRKILTEGFSWLQFPGMIDPVYVGVQFTPLRDKNETVCFALLFIKAPPAVQRKKN